MIDNMDKAEFLSNLKERVCAADWHRRYYTAQAARYSRWDIRIKGTLGVAAAAGTIMMGNQYTRIPGVVITGISGFIVGTILPNFRWDSNVSGLKEERETWTRIFYGYDSLLLIAQSMDKDEILAQEYHKILAMQQAAAQNDREVPEDKKLLAQCEKEVREYYKEKWP